MPLPQLQRGRALIITGPQGCGKSRLAHEVALQHTAVPQPMEMTWLEGRYGVTNALNADAQVLIIEGLPHTPMAMANIKQLLTAKSIRHRPPGALQPSEVQPPLLVFTTNDPALARQMAVDGRRFDLFDMGDERPLH